LQEFLPFVGLGGRLRLEWISSAEANKFVQVMTEFTEAIRQLGPNPLKRHDQLSPALALPSRLGEGRAAACTCGEPGRAEV